jgi:hypothetical protein
MMSAKHSHLRLAVDRRVVLKHALEAGSYSEEPLFRVTICGPESGIKDTMIVQKRGQDLGPVSAARPDFDNRRRRPHAKKAEFLSRVSNDIAGDRLLVSGGRGDGLPNSLVRRGKSRRQGSRRQNCRQDVSHASFLNFAAPRGLKQL